MGLISTTALAAHQIALQIAAILFMVPFGIGMAATVRVGHAVGRGDAPAVKRAGFVATGLGIVFMSVDDARRDPRPICDRGDFPRRDHRRRRAELTATLLLVGSTFFIADGIQTVAAGSLRGMNDTRIPLLFATISYWLIGFTLRLRARLPDAARRRRRLDRAVGRDRGLCHSSGLAFPAAREQAGVAMTVHEVTPEVDTNALLAGAQFVDAYQRSKSTACRRSMRGRPRSECWRVAAMGRGAGEACAIFWCRAVRLENVGRRRAGPPRR